MCLSFGIWGSANLGFATKPWGYTIYIYLFIYLVPPPRDPRFSVFEGGSIYIYIHIYIYMYGTSASWTTWQEKLSAVELRHQPRPQRLGLKLGVDRAQVFFEQLRV